MATPGYSFTTTTGSTTMTADQQLAMQQQMAQMQAQQHAMQQQQAQMYGQAPMQQAGGVMYAQPAQGYGQTQGTVMYAQPAGQQQYGQPGGPTVVVVQQAAAPSFVTVQPKWTDWNVGLFECFKDPVTCLCAYLLPCHVSGQIQELRTHPVRQGYCSQCCNICLLCWWCPAVVPCVLGSNRSMIRAQFYIVGDGCMDCLAHTFCMPCALTQELNEIKIRKGLVPGPGDQVMA